MSKSELVERMQQSNPKMWIRKIVCTDITDKILDNIISSIKKKREMKTVRKLRIFDDNNFTCQHCGRKGKYIVRAKIGVQPQYKLYAVTEDFHLLTIDHVLPKSKGGTDARYNLQTLCLECNWKKQDDASEIGIYKEI